MAFATRNLSVLAYANGFTLWHYKTARDTLLMVAEPSYFDDAVEMLTGGDMVMINAADATQTRVVLRPSGDSAAVTTEAVR